MEWLVWHGKAVTFSIKVAKQKKMSSQVASPSLCLPSAHPSPSPSDFSFSCLKIKRAPHSHSTYYLHKPRCRCFGLILSDTWPCFVMSSEDWCIWHIEAEHCCFLLAFRQVTSLKSEDARTSSGDLFPPLPQHRQAPISQLQLFNRSAQEAHGFCQWWKKKILVKPKWKPIKIFWWTQNYFWCFCFFPPKVQSSIQDLTVLSVCQRGPCSFYIGVYVGFEEPFSSRPVLLTTSLGISPDSTLMHTQYISRAAT